MNAELKNIISKDLFRKGIEKLTLKKKLFLGLEDKHLIQYRKAAYYYQKNPSSLKAKLACLKLNRMARKTFINIPATVKAGDGLYIGHLGRIIINPDVTLGNNVNLSTGITIGQANRGDKKGSPTIGNNVWIGTNAVIVGKITIGDDVMIAPGAFVNMDVPSHSIVLGNPGVIHHKDNATEGYINRTV